MKNLIQNHAQEQSARACMLQINHINQKHVNYRFVHADLSISNVNQFLENLLLSAYTKEVIEREHYV